MKLTVRQLFEALQKAEEQRLSTQEGALEQVKALLEPTYSTEHAAIARLHQQLKTDSRYGESVRAILQLHILFTECTHKVEIPHEIEGTIEPFVTGSAQKGDKDEQETNPS